MHFPPTEICTIEFFNLDLPIFCHLKRLVKILSTTNFRSWQSFFFLNQEHKNCTTQNHSSTDLVTIPTALALRRTRPQLPGRAPSLFALRTALARSTPPLSLVTTVALHSVSSQTSTPAEGTRNPSFETLLSPM